MNIKLNIEKNNKDFQILKDNEVLIRGVKPKWYSQQIRLYLIVGKTVITFISIKQIKNIGLNL